MTKPDERGNSFANGLESAGASVCNGIGSGPGAQEFAQGWPVRTAATIWDQLEPGLAW